MQNLRRKDFAMSPAPQRSHDEKMLLLLEQICDKFDWWKALSLTRLLGYKDSQTISAALEDLLQRGLIERREVTRPNKSIRFEYRGTQPGCEKLDQLRREGFL